MPSGNPRWLSSWARRVTPLSASTTTVLSPARAVKTAALFGVLWAVLLGIGWVVGGARYLLVFALLGALTCTVTRADFNYLRDWLKLKFAR